MNLSNLSNLGTWIGGLGGSIYAFFTENFDLGVQILILTMLVDLASGLMKGIQKKRLKSAIMHLGIMKKAGILLAVYFSTLLDTAVNGGTPVFTTMMIWISISNEGLSVIENLTALGVKIPKEVTEKLEQVKDKEQVLQETKDSKDGSNK